MTQNIDANSCCTRRQSKQNKNIKLKYCCASYDTERQNTAVFALVICLCAMIVLSALWPLWKYCVDYNLFIYLFYYDLIFNLTVFGFILNQLKAPLNVSADVLALLWNDLNHLSMRCVSLRYG